MQGLTSSTPAPTCGSPSLALRGSRAATCGSPVLRCEGARLGTFVGPAPALCRTVEMTLCVLQHRHCPHHRRSLCTSPAPGALLPSSCCTSHSLLEHTMDRGQLFRDRAPADQVRMRMLWRMCGANPAGKPAYSQQHHLKPCGCPQGGVARLDRRVWHARRRRD